MTGDGSPQVKGDEPPEGWKWTSIGTHYAFKNGLNKAKRFFGQGTPIINYMDVYGNQRLSAADVRGKVTVNNDEADAYSAFQGDAFFTRTSETVSEIGYSAILLEPIQRAVFSGFVLRGRPKSKELLPEYAAYALRARDVRKQIESRATYTTRALTNGGSLSECTFLLPPEPEQKRIAQALSDIDDLIASLDALITKKRDIKQGATQQLLTGKRRLPGFSGEWDEITLGTLGTFLKGAGIRRDQSQSGDIPCVRYGELYTHHNEIIRQFHSKVSVSVAQSATALQRGDILFAGSGETKEEIGKCAAFVSSDFAVAGGDIIILRAKDHSPEFLGYFLNMPFVARQKAAFAQGDAVVHIGGASLARIRLKIPKSNEQIAIAEAILALDADLQSLNEKKAKMEQVRQGMMQQLLTGRVRLI